MLFNLPQKATRRHGGAMQGLGFKNGLEWTSVYPYQNCVEILMAVQDWKYTAYFLCTRSLKTWVQECHGNDGKWQHCKGIVCMSIFDYDLKMGWKV